MTVVPPGGTETGGGLHGYALGVHRRWRSCRCRYGAVVRGARPAAVALLVLALAACAIVLFVDRPVLDDAGSDRPHVRPRRGAAGDRLLPREPGRGARAGRRGGGARPDSRRRVGNPARASAHYLSGCPSRCRPRPPRPRRRPRRVRGAGAAPPRRCSCAAAAAWSGDDRAADAAQDAVAHGDALARPPPRRPTAFGAWLVGIGLNTCRAQLRGSDPLTPLTARERVRGSDPLTPVEVVESSGARGAWCARRSRRCRGPARGGDAVLPRRPHAGRGGGAPRHPAGRGQDPAAQGARVAARAPRATQEGAGHGADAGHRRPPRRRQAHPHARRRRTAS